MMRFLYRTNQPIEFASAPELKAVGITMVSGASLKSLQITINNGWNAPSPTVGIYLEPFGAMTPSPGGNPLAVITSKPSHYQGVDTVVLTESERQAFSAFTASYPRLFAIVLSSTIIMDSNTAVPMGRVEITLDGSIDATY